MKKQQFITEIANALNLNITNRHSNGGGAGTILSLENKGKICVYVDRTSTQKTDRTLTIKLKGAAIASDIDNKYQQLIKFVRTQQRNHKMESAEVKKTIASGYAFNFHNGGYEHFSIDSLTIYMKNQDCPWK